jgi:hypothetical protein
MLIKSERGGFDREYLGNHAQGVQAGTQRRWIPRQHKQGAHSRVIARVDPGGGPTRAAVGASQVLPIEPHAQGGDAHGVGVPDEHMNVRGRGGRHVLPWFAG